MKYYLTIWYDNPNLSQHIIMYYESQYNLTILYEVAVTNFYFWCDVHYWALLNQAI